MADKQIAVVVLAAGGSRRMGHPKQLLQIEGQELLRRTVEVSLRSNCDWVLVTLGNEAQRCVSSVDDLNCSLVMVGDWREGLSRSIRRALEQIQEHNALTNSESPWYDAVLFVPCDLPELSASHLNALIHSYQTTSSPLVASRFGDIVGIPALFDASVWPEFAALSGDEGARKIIRRTPERVQLVDFEAGAIDIDTPQDYEAFVSKDFDHFQHK